jgi:starch synthase
MDTLPCNDAYFMVCYTQDAGLKRMSENEYANHPDIRILIMYNEALSHLIYAAADIVLVPSNFEPCGLTQVRLLSNARFG